MSPLTRLPLVMASCIQARKIVGVMTEISVHLKDILILPLQRPLEASDISRAKPLLALTLDKEETIAKFLFAQLLDYHGRTIRATIIYHQYMETLIKGEYCPDNLLHVLLLIISWNNNYRVTLMHRCFF